MADKLSKERRSWLMSRVASKHTKPERLVRSLLHHLGYRFTINGPKNKQLPGKPDIVLPSRRTAIFVHGCFWHRHPNCKIATTPKSNAAFWKKKFERNVERDREVQERLVDLKWRVIVVWECELKDLSTVAARLIAELPRSYPVDFPESLEDQMLVAEVHEHYGSKASE